MPRLDYSDSVLGAVVGACLGAWGCLCLVPRLDHSGAASSAQLGYRRNHWLGDEQFGTMIA